MTALRFSTTSVFSFSVILHKTRLMTDRLLACFAHYDEKTGGASVVTIFVRFCLRFYQYSDFFYLSCRFLEFYLNI